jgi:predicted SnoaL-like aldol condensation-catalyzing enzyme
MCGVARIIDVVDPYCGKDEVVNPGKSGLVRYLKGLAESRPCFGFRVREVRIYTSKDVMRSMSNSTVVSGEEIAAAWRAVAPDLAATGITKVVLHLVVG